MLHNKKRVKIYNSESHNVSRQMSQCQLCGFKYSYLILFENLLGKPPKVMDEPITNL